MPGVLRLLVVVIAVQLAIDGFALASGWAGADASTRLSAMLGLVLDVALLGALAHGSDRVRALVRIGATAGLALDVVLLVQWWAFAPAGPERTSTGALALALVSGSAFAVWALGHRDVQAWCFARWTARHGL